MGMEEDAMTTPKTLSPAEALRALADGKKLSLPGWSAEKYIYLNLGLGSICYNGGAIVSFTDYSGFIEYTEPRPKRKEIWVEYLASPTCSQVQSAGIYYFREGHIPEHTLWRYTETGRSLEVTIED